MKRMKHSAKQKVRILREHLEEEMVRGPEFSRKFGILLVECLNLQGEFIVLGKFDRKIRVSENLSRRISRNTHFFLKKLDIFFLV